MWSLDIYCAVKGDWGLEECLENEGDWRNHRLKFRLKTQSAGLLGDKKRCGLRSYDRCLLCDSGEKANTEHFLLSCEESEGLRERM